MAPQFADLSGDLEQDGARADLKIHSHGDKQVGFARNFDQVRQRRCVQE